MAKVLASLDDWNHVIVDTVPYCVSSGGNKIHFEGREPLDLNLLIESEKHRRSLVDKAANVSGSKQDFWELEYCGKKLTISCDGKIDSIDTNFYSMAKKKKSKTTPEAQDFVSKKIRKIKDEGKFDSHEQEVAVALSMARKEGYDIPENPNKKKAGMADQVLMTELVDYLKAQGLDDATDLINEWYQTQGKDIIDQLEGAKPADKSFSKTVQPLKEQIFTGTRAHEDMAEQSEAKRLRDRENWDALKQRVDMAIQGLDPDSDEDIAKFKASKESEPMEEMQRDVTEEMGQMPDPEKTDKPQDDENSTESSLNDRLERIADVLAAAEKEGVLDEAIQTVVRESGMSEEQFIEQLDNLSFSAAPMPPDAEEMLETEQLLDEGSGLDTSWMDEIAEAYGNLEEGDLDAAASLLKKAAEGMAFAKPGGSDKKGDDDDGEGEDTGSKEPGEKEESSESDSDDKKEGEKKDSDDSKPSGESKESGKKDSDDGLKKSLDVLKKAFGDDPQLADVLKMLEDALADDMMDKEPPDGATIKVVDLGTVPPAAPMHSHGPAMVDIPVKMAAKDCGDKECPKCKCDPCKCISKEKKKSEKKAELAEDLIREIDGAVDEIAEKHASPFWVDKGYKGLRLHDRVWRKADMDGLGDNINDEPGRVVAFGNGKAIVDWGDIDGIPTEENPGNLVIAERADGESTLFEVPSVAEADFKFNEEPQGAPMGSPVDPEMDKVLRETSLFDMLRAEASKGEVTSEDEVRHIATGKRGRVTARLSNGQMKVMVDGKELTLWSYEVS